MSDRWTVNCNSCCVDTDYRVEVTSDDTAGRLLDKICGGNNITVSLGGTAGDRCVVIDGPDTHDPVVVTSDDDSVDVTYNAATSTYDLSVNCCEEEDKFVATNAGCEPGYLIDNIVAAAGSPIIVSQSGCVVELDFDATAIPDLDRKVAVDSTCTAGFLEDQLTASDGIEINKSGCTLDIGLDADAAVFDRPRATITLENSELINVPGINYDNLIEGMTDIRGDSSMTGTDDIIIIQKSGPYRVSFKGIVEVNDHIHAFRIVLYSTNSEANSALDHKYSAGFSGGTFTGGSPMPLYSGGMGGAMIYSVGQSDVLEFEAGDAVALYLKANADVDPSYSLHPTGQIQLVGNDGTANTPRILSNKLGITLSVSYVGSLAV